jgi:hypothetical protein
MHALSAAVAPPWTCPQCGRRVPGREPLCHCGFAQVHAAAARPSAPAAGGRGRGAVRAAALVAGLAGLVLYAAVRRLDRRAEGAGPAPSPLARGQAIYPALPAIAPVKMRTGRAPPRAGVASAPRATSVPLRPLTAAEVDWDRAVALLDLPLRKLAAETSELELSYRRFADPCVAPGSGPASMGSGTGWLAALKTARLVPGVTIRERGANVDCEAVRKGIVARADALKADLAGSERLARTSGVRPEHWRQLLTHYALDVFDGY